MFDEAVFQTMEGQVGRAGRRTVRTVSYVLEKLGKEETTWEYRAGEERQEGQNWQGQVMQTLVNLGRALTFTPCG